MANGSHGCGPADTRGHQQCKHGQDGDQALLMQRRLIFVVCDGAPDVTGLHDMDEFCAGTACLSSIDNCYTYCDLVVNELCCQDFRRERYKLPSLQSAQNLLYCSHVHKA